MLNENLFYLLPISIGLIEFILQDISSGGEGWLEFPISDLVKNTDGTDI